MTVLLFQVKDENIILKEKNAKLSNELKRIKQKFGNGQLANPDPLEVQKFKFENIGGQGNLKENLQVLNDKIKLLQPTNDTKFHFLCKECQSSGKSLENLKLHLTLKHLEDKGEFTVQHFSGQNGLEIFIKFAKIEAVKQDSEASRLEHLLATMKKMPVANREMLKVLIRHLGMDLLAKTFIEFLFD